MIFFGYVYISYFLVVVLRVRNATWQPSFCVFLINQFTCSTRIRYITSKSDDCTFPLPSFNEYQDIGYAQTFEEAYERMDNLYREEEEGIPHENPPVEDFLVWRDLRIFDGKFPCFICYMQENTVVSFRKISHPLLLLCISFHYQRSTGTRGSLIITWRAASCEICLPIM